MKTARAATLTFLSVVLACGSPVTGAAERAGFLFAYYPKEGRRDEFDLGYRRHLEWHRERNDRLVWYAWYVASGERVGMFVDGTFGLRFADFDQRIAPAEDAADFKRTVAPYSDVAYRKVLELVPELSSATPLEERSPPASLEVLTCLVAPGREMKFEAAIKRLVGTSGGDSGLGFAVYRQLSGGKQPAYLLMIPRENYASFASAGVFTSLDRMVARSLAGGAREQTLEDLALSVREVYSEAWSYREDLSYFPGVDWQ